MTMLGCSSFGFTCGNQLWADGEQPVLCFAEDKLQGHRIEDYVWRFMTVAHWQWRFAIAYLQFTSVPKSKSFERKACWFCKHS